MTLLDLMKEVNNLTGIQGDISSVANLKDIQETLLMFVKQANLKIQLTSEDWKFMQGTLSLALDNTTVSTANTNVSKWKRVIWDRTDLQYVDYEDYLVQDWSVPGRPAKYTVVPETNELVVNALDGPYTLTVRYLKVPKDLVANQDTPLLPTRFHTLIAYVAAADFGSWLGNPEIEDKNLTNSDIMMGQMKRSEIPQKKMQFRPLA
jgi:hypothetical protein